MLMMSFKLSTVVWSATYSCNPRKKLVCKLLKPLNLNWVTSRLYCCFFLANFWLAEIGYLKRNRQLLFTSVITNNQSKYSKFENSHKGKWKKKDDKTCLSNIHFQYSNLKSFLVVFWIHVVFSLMVSDILFAANFFKYDLVTK